MDDNRQISDICKEKGQKFAQETGFVLGNLKFGLYHILEIEDSLDEADRRTKKLEEIEKQNKAKKEETEKQETQRQNAENDLNDINDNCTKEIQTKQNEQNKCESEIQKTERSIKTLQDKRTKGSEDARNGTLEYHFVQIIFWTWTTALICLYFFFWYNSLFFQSTSNYTSIIDSKFFITAFSEKDFIGLFVSLLLTAIPLGLSYLFHSNKSKWMIYGALGLAFLIDVFLAYRIVEHVFISKKFMGDIPKELSFSIWQCLKNVSFWLIFAISFLAYFVWGIFFLKLRDLKRPDAALENEINELEKKKNNQMGALEECKSAIKNLNEQLSNAEKSKNEKIVEANNRIKEISAELKENEKIMNYVKYKRTTTKLDLKMKSSFFYVGYMSAYRDNAPKRKSDDDLSEELGKKEAIIDAFVDEVEKSGKYLFI
jgi:hypothetical protein